MAIGPWQHMIPNICVRTYLHPTFVAWHGIAFPAEFNYFLHVGYTQYTRLLLPQNIKEEA